MNTSVPTIQLNDGHTLPITGLGTVGSMGNKGKLQVMDGIKAGYRLIDTATNYNNEGVIGRAIDEAGVSRDELIISSKLHGNAHDYDKALKIIEEQLARMNLEYFDKYLIHWPNPEDGLYVEAWKALIRAKELGYIKTIGVSNFLEHHLEKIIDATGIIPATNQIEIHPYFHNQVNVLANEKYNIVTEAWSPLGRDKNDVRNHERIIKIGHRYNKSASQVILRWLYQRNILSVVKSGDPIHQQENLDIFDFQLTTEEMDQLFALDKGEGGRVEGQHPDHYHEYV